MTPGLKRIRAARGMARFIADSLNISEPAVSKWLEIPAKRVLDIERITNIPRNELRPDLYPKESKRK